MDYEIIKTTTSTNIKRTNVDESVTWIPFDEANSDYQEYLLWLEGQNNPEAPIA